MLALFLQRDVPTQISRLRAPLLTLVLVVSCACGSEPPPWRGFPLFSDAGTMPSATGASGAAAQTQATVVPSAGAAVPPTAAAGIGVGMAASAGGAGGIAVRTPLTAAGSSGVAATTSITPAASLTTAFRVTEMYLRDPHVFIALSDVTDRPLGGVSVNGSIIPNKLNKDADGDGFFDVSLILAVRPFDASSTAATLTFITANCPTDASKPCSPIAGSAVPTAWPISYRNSGDCLESIAGTTSGYQPPVGIPAAPCLHSAATTPVVLDLGGIKIQVVGAQLGATYQTQPTVALLNGLLSGFVTNTAAMNAIIPMDVGAPVAGNPLSNYILQSDHDLASSPTMQDGFWMYVNFSAKPISYQP